MLHLIGQILGWLAAALTFLSYQCKTQKTLVTVQIFSVISICTSYMLLGAWSGMLLNIVCLVRNVFIICKSKKFFSNSFWQYFFPVAMAIVGALSWQGPMSLLVIMALVINTVYIYRPSTQDLRKSILVTSTMVATYNVYYTVWGGVVNELIAISSSVIGIIRFRNNKKDS